MAIEYLLGIGDADPNALNLLDRTKYWILASGGGPKFLPGASPRTLDLPIFIRNTNAGASFGAIARKIWAQAPRGSGHWALAQANVVLKYKAKDDTAYTYIDVQGPAGLEVNDFHGIPGCPYVFHLSVNQYARMDPVSYGPYPLSAAGRDAAGCITVSGSAGSYTLVFGGQTATITLPDSAAAIQAALAALSSVGGGNVNVYGPDGGPYIYQLVGARGNQAQALITTNGGTGGATATVTPATSGGIWLQGLKGTVPGPARLRIQDTSTGGVNISDIITGWNGGTLAVPSDLPPILPLTPVGSGVAHMPDTTAAQGTTARLVIAAASDFVALARALGPATGRSNLRGSLLARVRASEALVGAPINFTAVPVPNAGSFGSGPVSLQLVPRDGSGNPGAPSPILTVDIQNLIQGGSGLPQNAKLIGMENFESGNLMSFEGPPVATVPGAGTATAVIDATSALSGALGLHLKAVGDTSGGSTTQISLTKAMPVLPASKILARRLALWPIQWSGANVTSPIAPTLVGSVYGGTLVIGSVYKIAVTYIFSGGETMVGPTLTATVVAPTPAGPVGAPTFAGQAGGGSLVAGSNYDIAYSWVGPWGETNVSPTATLSGSNSTIIFHIETPPTGYTGINIYVSTAAGGHTLELSSGHVMDAGLSYGYAQAVGTGANPPGAVGSLSINTPALIAGATALGIYVSSAAGGSTLLKFGNAPTPGSPATITGLGTGAAPPSSPFGGRSDTTARFTFGPLTIAPTTSTTAAEFQALMGALLTSTTAAIVNNANSASLLDVGSIAIGQTLVFADGVNTDTLTVDAIVGQVVVFTGRFAHSYNTAATVTIRAAAPIGNPFILAPARLHLIEFDYDVSGGQAQLKVLVDGVNVAGSAGAVSITAPTFLTIAAVAHGTTPATTEEYYIDDITDADGMLGPLAIAGAAAIQVDRDVGPNEAGLDLYYTNGPTTWFHKDLGASPTMPYLLTSPYPSGVELRNPPSGPPAVRSSLARISTGLAAATPVLIPGRSKTPALAAGRWEWRDFGGHSLGGTPRQGQPSRRWVAQLEAYNLNGGQTFDADALAIIDQAGERAELTALGLTALALWDYYTNPNGDGTCELTDPGTGLVIGEAAVSGPFHIGPGNGWLVLLPSVRASDGTPIADAPNASALVTIDHIPFVLLTSSESL